MGSTECLNLTEEANMAPEALKEIITTSSVEKFGSINVEFPLSHTETVSVPLKDGIKAVKLPVYGDEGGVTGCLESETKHSYCPDSEKFAEVECEISSSEINFLTEILAPDLEPEITSSVNMQFSDGNHFSYVSGVGQAHLQEPPFSGSAKDVAEGRLYHPPSKASGSFERNLASFLEVSNASNGQQAPLHSSCGFSISVNDGVPAGRHTHEQPGSTVIPELLGCLAPVVDGSAPLQSCPSSTDMQSGSYNNQVKLEAATNSSGLIYGNNSVAVADFSCHADEERKGSGVMSSVQRSPSLKKHARKESKRTYTRKGAKKVLCRTIDLLPPAVRSKRSCLSRTPCALKWGSADILSEHINQSCEDQELGFIENNGKARKQKKAQTGRSSEGYKGANLASSGHIRLKVKLGKESNGITLRGPPVGTDSVADVPRDCIKFPNSVVNLKKPATSQERTEVGVQPLDNDIETTLSLGKSSALGESNNSDKEAEKSGVSTDDRHMNSGTSPDSEIVQAQDSLFASKALGLCRIRERNSCKAPPVLDDNTIPAKTKTRRGKVNKKEKHLSFGGSDPPDRLGPAILSQSTVSKVYCRDDAISSAANGMARILGPVHKSAEPWKSIEFLPPDEAQRTKKSKGSKAKGATKSKKRPINAQRSDMDTSHKGKGDKWRLKSKYSISENGTSDQVYKTKGCLEAGNSAMNKTNAVITGGLSKDVSGLSTISGGIGQQIMRPQTAWVCCDDCSKWRCIPAKLANVIEETSCRWTCKDNEDKAFAGCSIPQEKSNAEINAELNISGGEDGRGANSDGKCNNMKHAAASPQSSWMLIKSSIFLHRSRKTQSLDEIMVCHCKPPRDGKSGCGDECLNRMLNIECAQEACPCGELCSNQQFQKRDYADLQWFRCGKKGYGLEVLEDISEGQFLIEYVGEVLDFPTYEARQREYASKGLKHFYFMTLSGSEVIDACAKGNLGRFINHSCDPNCRTEKWMVNGEICIGFFAVRDIKKGEELTFDYNYVRVFGAAAMKCHCGSPHCRGYIGGDPLNSELIVQGDSDEEFPEPVAIYENGDLSDSLDAMLKPSSPDDVEKKIGDSLLRQAAIVLPGGEEILNKVKETATPLQGRPPFTEKDEVHHSVVECSQVQGSSEISVDSKLEIRDKITDDFQEKKSASDRIGTASLSPKMCHSSPLDELRRESFSVCFGTLSEKSKNEVSGNKPTTGGRPRMKICRLSGSVNGTKSCISRTIIYKDPVIYSTATDKASMINRSPSGSGKPNILVESAAKPGFETVEQKLNELLDSVGGIRKRKDAFKGYLKLLYQTAASGDGSHCEIIQSNRDLSMILDAILKTKSRRVLTDIIHKNGLQMLHSMMKKCRGNFSMIPILRKLLKVFEFLAERKILTVEDINRDSHRPGVESFRDSVLKLTEHQDKKVHQIARNFRDSWIPKPVKKYDRVEKSDQKMESNRAPKCSSFPGSRHCRPETMGHMKHSPSPSRMIDAEVPESASLRAIECVTNMGTARKRKSRWDQPAALVSPHCTEGQRIELSCRADEERREMEEDAPPGFSSPLNVPLKCPSKVPLGHLQQRFNPHSPVAYGIPLEVVLEFGTRQAATADGWVIAPGQPFHPFPPLPPLPRKGANCGVTTSTANTW